jgi:membrane associated rhomboid family serine protease
METINRLRNRWGISHTATVDIIIVNVFVFVLMFITGGIPVIADLISTLRLKPAWGDFMHQPWSLFTYIFLHAGFMHLLGNMLWLYFIGILLEDLIGRRHINKLFVWGGIAGGLVFLLAYNLIPVFASQPMYPMVGASGGVTAVIVAAAAFSPRYTIYLFGVVAIQLRWIALIRITFDLLGLGDGMNDGGQLAHLAGAAFGFLYILNLKGDIRIPLPSMKLGKKKKQPFRNIRVEINQPVQNRKKFRIEHPRQEEIDAILDKINQSGYESLSKEEKEILFRASDR